MKREKRKLMGRVGDIGKRRESWKAEKRGKKGRNDIERGGGRIKGFSEEKKEELGRKGWDDIKM